MFRAIRAAVVIGVVWALAWLPVGGLIVLYAGSRPPRPDDLLYRPVDGPLFLTVWTVWGALSGFVFATILSRAERRRTLAELSLARAAVWGSLGAMLLPALLIARDVVRGWTSSPLYSWRPAVVSVLLSLVLGAACALGTLVLARRAP